MPLPDIHARTHLPGGTDPIAISSGLPVASASDGQRSQTANGTYEFKFRFIYWNDSDVFGYTQVTTGPPNRAQYILLKQEGFYRVKYMISWASDLSVASVLPFIQPTVWFPSTSSSGTLVNSVDADAWDDTQGIIYGEQFTTAEADHHQLSAEIMFTFTEAQFGESPIGIGLSLHTSASATANFGAGFIVTKYGDALTQQTIT